MNTGKTPESRVLADCLKYLQLRGIYHWRNSVGAGESSDSSLFRPSSLKGENETIPETEAAYTSPEQRALWEAEGVF